MIELSSQIKELCITTGLSHSELSEIIDSDDIEFYLDFIKLQGLDLKKDNSNYYPRQLFQALNETSCCIVDIETNGSDFQKHQIIEIGAVMIKNGVLINRFDSLIQASTLPSSIARLTGISLSELKTAPTFKSVMHQFKDFIKDEIIVAHPLKFDYNFLSASFEKADLGSMLNLGICNIALAERTLSSAKYGLNYLNQTLNIKENFQQHRAYNDAIITKEIFLKAINNLPKEVKNIQELLVFIKEAKKQPRAALQEL